MPRGHRASTSSSSRSGRATAPRTSARPSGWSSAELARLDGPAGRGARAPTRRPSSAAREHGFIQNVALASELAARFWRARQAPTIARRLRARGPRGVPAVGRPGQGAAPGRPVAAASASAAAAVDDRDDRSTDSTQIDALTVVKAQQAISGEIVLERLVTTLMQVAIENAGAQRGALLLPERGHALGGGHLRRARRRASRRARRGRALPWTLISYVKRTREHVLIGDASKPHPFSSDAYLARSGARSVLCLPLLRQEQFRGVLYLENNLATNAFTPRAWRCWGTSPRRPPSPSRTRGCTRTCSAPRRPCARPTTSWSSGWRSARASCRQAQARLVDTARAGGHGRGGLQRAAQRGQRAHQRRRSTSR